MGDKQAIKLMTPFMCVTRASISFGARLQQCLSFLFVPGLLRFLER